MEFPHEIETIIKEYSAPCYMKPKHGYIMRCHHGWEALDLVSGECAMVADDISGMWKIRRNGNLRQRGAIRRSIRRFHM